jgi:hypothetical protein
MMVHGVALRQSWLLVADFPGDPKRPLCRDEGRFNVAGSRQVDGYVVVRDPFIPPAQCPAGSFFDDSLLVVLTGKAADSINTGEECDRGEHDLMSVLLAQ